MSPKSKTARRFEAFWATSGGPRVSCELRCFSSAQEAEWVNAKLSISSFQKGGGAEAPPGEICRICAANCPASLLRRKAECAPFSYSGLLWAGRAPKRLLLRRRLSYATQREGAHNPSLVAPFTVNSSPFRMYFRSVATLRCPVWRIMVSSGTPARAAVVTCPALRLCPLMSPVRPARRAPDPDDSNYGM